jgi:hypothetical protein
LRRARLLRAGALLLVIFVWADLSAAAGAQTGLRIRRIRIESENVFQDAETLFLGRIADAIHGTTRADVIRRELLFSEGDLLDPAKLVETERNLRLLGLFRTVAISGEPVAGSPDEIDIVVHTRDAWTTELSGNLGRAGGRAHYGVSIEEKNLFGQGKKISLAVAQRPDRSTREILYSDPQFLGQRLGLDLLYDSNSDGDRRHFSLTSGFRSLDSPRGGTLLFDQGRSKTRLYANGGEVARFEMDTRSYEVSAGRRLSLDGDRPVTRLFVGYRRQEARFGGVERSPDGFVLPDERRFGYVFARVEIARPEFAVEHNVGFFLRDEDFDVGRQLSLEVGYSPSILNAQTAVGAGATWSQGLRIPRGFLIASLGASTRARDGSLENTLVEGELLAVWRPSDGSPQTVVGRALVTYGHELDREVQVEADGANGLRAYRLHAFAGDRRVVLNLEDRVRLTPELLHLFVLGVAAFVDAGYAWPTGEAVRLADLRVDAGLGLRVGLPRASRHALFRIDLAYALRPDLRGRRGWLVSFSSSQAF